MGVKLNDSETGPKAYRFIGSFFKKRILAGAWRDAG
jgi:hypothetical protein